jgi:hypothetical protein
LHGSGDLAAEPSPVELVHAPSGQQPVGGREIGVAEDGADPRQRASGEEQLAGGGEPAEPLGVLGGLLPEGLVDDEAPSAIRIAGRSAWRSETVPQRSSAPSQLPGVPGTPTDSPLVTASSKGIGWPFSTNESVRIRCGAVSRPSIPLTRLRRAS